MYQLTKVISFFLLMLVSGITQAQFCDKSLTGGEMSEDTTYCKDLFHPAEKMLNKAYKELIPMLDARSKNVLKNTQREWIKWREARCEKAVEQSSCQNSSCELTNQAYCMTWLASQRAEEIMKFKADLKSAKDQSFAFNKRNKQLDP